MRDRHFRLDHRRAPGLVGLWGPGPPGGPTAYDESGYGNDGILTNGPTWVPDAERGWVVDFVAASNQYVQLPNNSKITSPGGALSITAWFRHDNPANAAAILDNLTGGTFEGYHFARTSSKIRFYVENDAGVSASTFSTTEPTDNVWYHAAGTYDGANIRVFVNGTEEDSDTLTGNIVGRQPRIGHYQSGNSYWNGGLSGVRLYDRGLSPAEVQHIFQTTRPNPYGDIRMKPRRVVKAPVAAGLSIPIAMRHYLQMMGAG